MKYIVERIKWLVVGIQAMGFVSGIKYQLGIAKEGVDFWSVKSKK